MKKVKPIAETLGAVHTHTHTHTGSLKDCLEYNNLIGNNNIKTDVLYNSFCITAKRL